MIANLHRLIEMQAENRWCINRCKDRTIFEKDGIEYVIFWVKNYAVKLLNIDNIKETDWINVEEFQNFYKNTGYCLKTK